MFLFCIAADAAESNMISARSSSVRRCSGQHQRCSNSFALRSVYGNDDGAEVQNLISSPVYFTPQSFDVLHYDVHLDLSNAPALTTSNSRCDIRFRWLSTPDSFRFHLRLLKVDSVYYSVKNGASFDHIPVPFVKNGADSTATMHYAVAALPTHRIGDTVVVSVVYSGTMGPEAKRNGSSWGGVANDGKDAVYALGVGMYNNYVSCTQHWMPCYDLPSDKATFTLECICPDTYRCASIGRQMSESVISGGRKTYRWESAIECATYLMTFAVGPYNVMSFGQGSTGSDIVVYAKSSDTNGVKTSCRYLPKMVSTFESVYGPFPFEKVGYVVTTNGSMEHQTMISLARGELALNDTINEHVAHELAHQWFGDYVTAFDYRDGWLSESFATFSECVWLESMKGRVGYLADLKYKIATYMTSVGKPGGFLFEGILPIYDFSRKAPSSNYPQTIYVKGAGVLAMLRYMTGDTIFYRSLRDYLQSSRYANATYDSVVHAFIRNVPVHLQDSIEQYFSQWVKGKGWPLLDIQTARGFSNGRWQSILHIKQVQPDSFGVYTWFPLELSFKDDSGHVIHKVITINAKELSLTLDSLNNYSSIAVNSGTRVHSLIALTRTPSITDVSRSDDAAAELTIYPNPAREILWIRVPDSGLWSVEIQNERGQQQKQLSSLIPTNNLLRLDVHDLLAGAYFLSVTSGQRVYSKAITIVR